MRVLRARSLLCAGLVSATLAAGCNAQAPDRTLELDLVESDGSADVFVFKTDAERSTSATCGRSHPSARLGLRTPHLDRALGRLILL